MLAGSGGQTVAREVELGDDGEEARDEGATGRRGSLESKLHLALGGRRTDEEENWEGELQPSRRPGDLGASLGHYRDSVEAGDNLTDVGSCFSGATVRRIRGWGWEAGRRALF